MSTEGRTVSIDYDRFLEWAESRFDDVVPSGDEVKINSVFCEDRKRHLWCNPSGGKTGSDLGVYHCWKTGSKGNLIGLVMIVDGCSYEEAMRTLDIAPSGGIAELERRVADMFASGSPRGADSEEERSAPGGLELPPDCYPFDDLPSSHRLRSQAEAYLGSRSIPTDGLMVCTSGRYRNRIVIPYLDRSGTLIYYNGRYVGDAGSNLRYLGPPKELGVGKGDVLYSRNWPDRGEKVYITEGEFDAMSLDLSGLAAVALGGKNMTSTQIAMISGLKPVLALDADDSGGEALPRIAHSLFRAGFKSLNYVRPSKEHKDWNGLLAARGATTVGAYVRMHERPYDAPVGGDWEGTRLGINEILR